MGKSNENQKLTKKGAPYPYPTELTKCRATGCERNVENSQKRCACGCDYPGIKREDLKNCPDCWGLIPMWTVTCSHCNACMKKKYPCFGTAVIMFGPMAFLYSEVPVWSGWHIAAFAMLAFVCVSSFILGLIQVHTVRAAQSRKTVGFGLLVCAVLLVAAILIGGLMIAARAG